MAEAAVAADPKRRAPTATEERFGLSENLRRDFIHNAAAGVTPQDVQKSAYWAHVAQQLTAFDTIEVRADDGSWIAHLRVLFAERTFAKVALERLFEVKENVDVGASSTKFRVDHKGPQNKWCVIRLSDGAIVKSECRSREEATAWMIEHEKAVR